MNGYESFFHTGLVYGAFLEKYGTDDHRRRWADVHAKVRLSDDQRRLLGGFVREMHVLCLAGAWCGDCVGQCPIFDHFARATPKIDLRFVDRDADAGLAGELRVCGGSRVPVVVFLSEDFAECGRYGDRTLSRYRAMTAELSGAACSTGIVDSAALHAVTTDWLGEFERVQLMLRTSPRLRQKHGD
ncbi:MAG: thioredoxin family protein [Phycisphaerales bacterium]|nr:thioredoxin family protein [Phycisphaerales bacterium]